MLERILSHLSKLVSCDTQNPPRQISPQSEIVQYCHGVLTKAGCDVAITDHGDGCVNILATRGSSDLLFNCHLDTVPADPAWSTDPFTLKVDETKASGLGACDIKGAAACLLAVAESTDAPLNILLSTDEEAGNSDCVKEFVKSNKQYQRVIVCEPTNGFALTKHRGIETFELDFTGHATHSSQLSAHADNALHHAAEWAAAALEYTHQQLDDNLRFNIGIIQGGVKTNIAASSAKVRFGIRPNAETNVEGFISTILSFLKDASRAQLTHCFSAPALGPTTESENMVNELGLAVCDPADFWTEAALFTSAASAVIVIGPGDISQAHAPDEHVPLDDLERVAQTYARIISSHSQSNAHQAQASHSS